MTSFLRHRKALGGAIKHNLDTVATAMFSQDIISSKNYERALNRSKIESERCSFLLNSVKSRIEAKPSRFFALIGILELEPYYQPLVDMLRHSYGE